jgi:ABC-type proline/glycine betaine transport system permease subunit
VISTPVILLVMDLGTPVATALLTDRLAATLMGAAIVVVLNIILERVTTRPSPPTPNAVSA